MADWWREYRYRQLIPMPHEAYMEEPVGVVEWMLRLDNLRLEVEHEWQAQ